MTYNELISHLREISPDEYEFEARVLIESLAGDLAYSYVFLHREEDILPSKLIEALEKRRQHIPLQYIVGKWDFYRQTYIVNESCLIPRSDTEVLVEKAVSLLPNGAHFLDLCTGSGCIAISTLCERVDTSAVMVDKFENTLQTAIENAKINGVSDRVSAYLFDILTEEIALEGRQFDAILSNPPYICPEVIETLSEEVKKEPYAALYGGDDGLIFYRKIVEDYSVYLKKDGFFLFEIGYDQGKDLQIISEQNGFLCEIIKDYSGNDRVAYLRKR